MTKITSEVTITKLKVLAVATSLHVPLKFSRCEVFESEEMGQNCSMTMLLPCQSFTTFSSFFNHVLHAHILFC